jgi:hypothetical protein
LSFVCFVVKIGVVMGGTMAPANERQPPMHLLEIARERGLVT